VEWFPGSCRGLAGGPQGPREQAQNLEQVGGSREGATGADIDNTLKAAGGASAFALGRA